MDSENNSADDIASAITKILIKAFADKEGRDPTNQEIEMLFEELTEERIESMLNGTEEPAVSAKEDFVDNDEESDCSDAEEQEPGGETKEVPKETENGAETVAEGSPNTGKRAVEVEAVTDQNGSPVNQNKKSKVQEEAEVGSGHD